MSPRLPSPLFLYTAGLLACGGHATPGAESKDGRDSGQLDDHDSDGAGDSATDSGADSAVDSGADSAVDSAGDSGEPPPACPDAVATCVGDDCRFDINLVAHVLGGTLSYDGGALPDSRDNSGSDYYVRVVDQETGGTITEEFVFDQPWSLTLPPGTYDVFAQLIVQGQETHMGANVKIADNLELSGDTTLDADLVPFVVGGRTTFEGGAVPDTRDANDYELHLDSDGYETEAKFAASEAWSVLLPAGHYDAWVRMSGGATSAQRKWAWAGAFDVGADTSFDIDAAYPQLSGHPSLDGADLADGNTPLEEDYEVELLEVTTRDDEEAAYLHDEDMAVEVPAGVYDVELSLWDLPDAGESGYVQVTWPAVSLLADGVLDLDVETVSISGTVLLDGVDAPDTASELDACVYFRSVDGLVSARSCNAAGEPWTARLPPGTYDVEATLAADDDEALSNRPRHRVASGLELVDGAEYAFDTSFATLSGRFTYASGPMPNPAHDPREAYFVWVTNVETEARYSEGFPFSQPFSFDLPSGIYDVEVRMQTQGATPIVSEMFRAATGLVVVGDTTLHVDMPVARLAGEVRVEGFLVDSVARQDFSVNFESENGFSDSRDFPAAEGYTLRLWPGIYQVKAGLAQQSRPSDLDSGMLVARCLLVEP